MGAKQYPLHSVAAVMHAKPTAESAALRRCSVSRSRGAPSRDLNLVEGLFQVRTSGIPLPAGMQTEAGTPGQGQQSMGDKCHGLFKVSPTQYFPPQRIFGNALRQF